MPASTLTFPRLSVVVPSFNQAEYLEAALRSALDQNYPQLELIVLDGGSTDGSRAIIEQYAPRLAYWQSQPDGGQAAALNAGFARATGDILTWLNSDDVFYPGALSLVGEAFARFPEIAWLTGIPANMDAAGRLAEIGPRTGRFRPFIQRGWQHGRALGFIRQEGTFWRRGLWERAGARLDPQRHLTLDYDLWRRFAAHADLVTAASILAVFRYQPRQKTADLDRYYAEIGTRLPERMRLLMLPLRAFLAITAWPLAPRLRYHRASAQWRFSPGPFFRRDSDRAFLGQ